jgi:hypothetical protein
LIFLQKRLIFILPLERRNSLFRRKKMKKHLFLGSLTAALALFAACGGAEDELINSVPAPHEGKYSITVNVTDVEGLEGQGSANVITATGRAPAPSANSGDELILTVNLPVGGGGAKTLFTTF